MMLLFIFLLSATTASAYYCPTGYNNEMINFKTYCIKTYSTPLTHAAAVLKCGMDGGSLVQINDLEFNSIITSSASSSGQTFIGVKCYDTNFCIYDNGVRVTNMMSNFFIQPKANTESCVILDSSLSDPFSKKWASVDCSTASSFICQTPPVVSIQNVLNTNCGYPYTQTVTSNTSYVISSPSFPSYYNNMASCYYTFDNGPFNIIFSTFQTEDNRDILRIYTATSPTSQLTYYNSYSGDLASNKINVNAKTIVLVFTTDNMNTYKGFNGTVSKA